MTNDVQLSPRLLTRFTVSDARLNYPDPTKQIDRMDERDGVENNDLGCGLRGSFVTLAMPLSSLHPFVAIDQTVLDATYNPSVWLPSC